METLNTDMSDASPTPPPVPNDATPVAPAPKAPPEAPAPLPLGTVATLLANHGIAVEALPADAKGTEMFVLPDHAQVLQAATLLRDDETLAFDLLVSASGVDAKTHRETVYHFYSTQRATWVGVVVKADANEQAPSLKPVFHAADWHEREAYDLLGITYVGHDDLRRILMPDYWLGHPLRKDYQDNDPRLVWNKR